MLIDGHAHQQAISCLLPSGCIGVVF